MKLEDQINEIDDLAQRLGLTRGDVLEGLLLHLGDVRGVWHLTDLWDIEISMEEAERIVREVDYSFRDSTIEFDVESLPSNALFRTKVAVKSGGMKWVVHASDPDPFPSDPHAHCYDQNIKLDLISGECYRGRKPIGSLNTKELMAIRKLFEQRGLKMPTLTHR